MEESRWERREGGGLPVVSLWSLGSLDPRAQWPLVPMDPNPVTGEPWGGGRIGEARGMQGTKEQEGFEMRFTTSKLINVFAKKINNPHSRLDCGRLADRLTVRPAEVSQWFPEAPKRSREVPRSPEASRAPECTRGPPNSSLL